MTGSFAVVGETRLLDTGFVAVDRVVLRAGDETHERHVVRHPGAVVVVPIDAEGRAVLVRQYRIATGGDLLEVPAGKRDHAGEPPELTASRELEEEVGQRAGRLVKLAEFWNSPGFCDEYSHVFAALDLEVVGDGQGAPTSVEESAMTIETIALTDVERLITERRLVDAKSIIALLLVRQHLAGAHRPLAP